MEEKLRILILYQFQEHDNLLHKLKEKLVNKNIELSFFNTRTFKFSEKSHKYWFLQLILKIPKLRVLVYYLFRNKIILSLSAKYEIIDIHYLSTIYDQILGKLSHKNVKISFWGSDAYRITDERKQKLNTITAHSKIIRFNTVEMFTKMEKYFERKDKLGYQIFGNSFFDSINEINASKTEAKKKLNIPTEKISVFVGYNASKGQQHQVILNQLNNLQSQLKDRLVLILTLTYGADNQFKERIITTAQQTGIETIFFKNTLNETEISLLRLSSDIVINFQISDAFSGSLQEHFYTNSIMILGEWLPYKWLESKDLFFYSINENRLKELIIRIIQNLEKEKQKFESNKNIIYSISSWEAVTELWANEYKQMIK